MPAAIAVSTLALPLCNGSCSYSTIGAKLIWLCNHSSQCYPNSLVLLAACLYAVCFFVVVKLKKLSSRFLFFFMVHPNTLYVRTTGLIQDSVLPNPKRGCPCSFEECPLTQITDCRSTSTACLDHSEFLTVQSSVLYKRKVYI